MKNNLKKEIEILVTDLRAERKPELANAIESNWDKTVFEYSCEINAYKPKKPMENILKKAIEMELTRVGHPHKKAMNIVAYLEKHRALQTAPHLVPTNKPRFFFIDWLTSLCRHKNDFYVVAMFSGVPFSNNARPGRLCMKKDNINLIPSSMQDELVYRNKIPEKMIGVLQALPPKLRALLPVAKLNDSYTAWALEAIRLIESKFLNGKSVFLDFNEIISNYILTAIKDADHPLTKMLFSKPERKRTIKNFQDMVFFYGQKKNGKDVQMENFFLKDGYLESPSRKIKLDKETLTNELKGQLCPGLVIGFFVLAFLNDFQCFGSFAQIEYLPLYRKKFAKFPFLKKYKIDLAPAGALTTGGFPEDTNLHALDVALGEKFSADKNMLFGEALLAIKDVLLHQNYSANLIRK